MTGSLYYPECVKVIVAHQLSLLSIFEGLKTLNKGIRFDNNILNCLTYADDVLILAENEKYQQDLFIYVHGWCRK